MGLLARMKRRRGRRAARTAEADAALIRTRAARREATARGPEVTAVVGRLREHRERNHFAEMIEQALRGGH
jgi:predicted nucleic acid-binding protein